MQNWITRRTYTTCHDLIDIGDIFYTDLGINYMPEFSYHHPVIVLEKVGTMVLVAVSYTHLDVYKRQLLHKSWFPLPSHTLHVP